VVADVVHKSATLSSGKLVVGGGGAVVAPVTPAAHIVDADGTLADITTKFNTLLTVLEALDALATS